jgi:signal transduction protein with GAF and PtsI domain
MLHSSYYCVQCSRTSTGVVRTKILSSHIVTFFVIIEAVSKTRELELRLQRAEQQLRLFQRVSRLMTRDMELDDVLQEIVNLVRDFLECDSCLIYLIEEEELVLYASNEPNRQNLGRVRLRLSEGLTGWVARERRLLAISREAYNDSRFKFFKDLPQDRFEAFLSAPIISQNKVVGVINVQHREARIHSGADMELLSTLGEQVGCLLVLSRQKSPRPAVETNV